MAKTLVIDVTNVVGKTHPDDSVALYAPRVRGSADRAGGVVSTAARVVHLVDGQARVENVEPGPMVVEFHCANYLGGEPVEVVVPDGSGTVTLRALIESKFKYSPSVQTAVEKAADKAADSERAAITAQRKAEDAASKANAKVDGALSDAVGALRKQVQADLSQVGAEVAKAAKAAEDAEKFKKAAEGALDSKADKTDPRFTDARPPRPHRMVEHSDWPGNIKPPMFLPVGLSTACRLPDGQLKVKEIPTDKDHAASKKYVDDVAAAIAPVVKQVGKWRFAKIGNVVVATLLYSATPSSIDDNRTGTSSEVIPAGFEPTEQDLYAFAAPHRETGKSAINIRVRNQREILLETFHANAGTVQPGVSITWIKG
jgi:hypothetical protein